MAIVESNALVKYKDTSGNLVLLYPITKKENVDGIDELVRNQGVTTSGDGAAYTAAIDGITSLSSGVGFTMIPHVSSTTAAPTLNVNGLGAKLLRRRVSNGIGTTTTGASDDWITVGKPVNVMYDGTFWIVDLVRPNANDIMGIVAIQNGGTGASTAADARVNLGIETADGTVTSGNADYAEVGEWADGNPSSENRVGYFVCVDLNNPGIIIRKGTASDDIKGVTVAAPAFAGNCSEDKFDENGSLLPKYSYVAVTGIVQVIDNGTCTVGERCMPTSDGVAGPVSGNYGYLVMDRIDSTHVLISVDPSVTAQYKFKNYIDNKHFNKTATLSTNWIGDSAPYTQTVSIPGILEDDDLHIGPVYSETLATAITEKESWGMVSDTNVTSGSIEFICFEDKPTVPINIQIEVNR